MSNTILITSKSININKNVSYQNRNVFDMKIMNMIEFCKYILLVENTLLENELINSKEELTIYSNIINSNDNVNVTNLSDIQNYRNIINTLRKLIINNEEETIKDILTSTELPSSKKTKILNIYKDYINELTKQHRIDEIGLIRYVIDACKQTDMNICIINELDYRPLDIELIKKISNNTYKTMSIFDIYDVDNNKIIINTYKNYYGINNETNGILNQLINNNQIDKSTIACGDYKSYAQLFFDVSIDKCIPITFSKGISLINSNPGKLLNIYDKWTSSNFDNEVLKELINSNYFNSTLLNSEFNNEENREINKEEFFEIIFNLKLTNNKYFNQIKINNFKIAINDNNIVDEKYKKYLAQIEVVSNELALPIEEFIDKYAFIRNDNEFLNKLDIEAKKYIYDEIKYIKEMGFDLNNDSINQILNTNVCKSGSKPGYLHVTTIDDALFNLRDNLYLCGLSSSTYPGSPKEDPILLDSDLRKLGCNELTSTGKIEKKKEALFNLLKLAAGLGNRIHLSYPGINVSELKQNNASSLLYEIYKYEHGIDASLEDFDKTIKKIGYFDNQLSINNKIGNAYNDDRVVECDNKKNENLNKTKLSLYEYSPSALETFFRCKKQFYYKYLLKLETYDELNKYEVIGSDIEGSLLHSLMEYLPDHKMSKDEFVEFGEKCFDEYLKINVPLIDENVINEKKQFLEMLENGYDLDMLYKRNILNKEVNQHAIHNESSVRLHGYPDRVEIDDNGKAIIIDFKSERRLDSHKKDDIDSCLQVLIYAYIVEKTLGVEVDHCEYRMLRYKNKIITCKYDEEIKKQLSEKLIEFKKTIDSGDFSIEVMNKETENDKCKYCKYGLICGKVVKEDDE